MKLTSTFFVFHSIRFAYGCSFLDYQHLSIYRKRLLHCNPEIDFIVRLLTLLSFGMPLLYLVMNFIFSTFTAIDIMSLSTKLNNK